MQKMEPRLPASKVLLTQEMRLSDFTEQLWCHSSGGGSNFDNTTSENGAVQTCILQGSHCVIGATFLANESSKY